MQLYVVWSLSINIRWGILKDLWSDQIESNDEVYPKNKSFLWFTAFYFLQQTIHYLNFKKKDDNQYLLVRHLSNWICFTINLTNQRIYTSLKWKYNVHYVTAWILNWNLIQELLLVWKEEAQGPHHLPEQQWSLSFDQSSFMKYNYTLDNLVKNK